MWQQLSTVDNFDADFIERRRVGLEGFLQRVGAHLLLCKDTVLHGFLQQEDGWKDTVLATGFQAKVRLSQLRWNVETLVSCVV